MASILSGVALLGLFWRRIRSRRLIWTLAIGLPAFVAVIAFWIGAGLLRERFGTQDGIENEASFRSRFLIWTAVARNFPEFLWVGSGLGTFEESFAPYTPPGSVSIWDKAHNDYLQAAWETGIIGLVLFGAVASSFVMRYVWPGISSRGDPLDLFRIAISISMLSIALHSVVDFNLQIGANSFLFVLLAGLLVALQRVRPEARAAGAKRVDHEPA